MTLNVEGGSVTATKAVAGGVGGSLVVIANWLVTLIPGWSEIPDEPRGAIVFLLSTAITAGLVYYAPSNKHVM
jgi:hypothetical protein